MDDSLIIGSVFDDRDADGWQDPAKATNVRVQGGFAADAYVAGSTVVGRGQGWKPEADHSAPLLHGVSLGTVAGRNSDADPSSNHEVVIRQILAEPRFTDDFVLTTSEGTELHMDAAGKTTLVRSGELAKGLTAQQITVTRELSQSDAGYVVDYVVRNQGVDERGIPGVRIASVEGLIMETDAHGRFHVEGIDAGDWSRGRNFILKVDPATVPPGSIFTTENPRVQRVTPGVPVRYDFGIKLPSGVIEGGTHETEIELGNVLFAPESADVKSEYQPVLDAIADKIRKYDGGVLIVSAQAEQEALALARASAVQLALQQKLDADVGARFSIRVQASQGRPDTLVGLGRTIELGSVLFGTGEASIKPQYTSLIAAIARILEARNGGVVTFVGRADHRGDATRNLELGLRRAKAVYQAVAAELKPDVRSRVRVEVSDATDTARDAGKRQ